MTLLFILSLWATPFTSNMVLEHEDFRKPVALVQNGDQTYVLDRDEGRVFLFKGNKAYGFFGRKGQGPGEFQRPSAMAWRDGTVLVYDLGRGKLIFFKPDGNLKKEINLRTATNAVFDQDTLVLHTPMDAHLYEIFDFNGARLCSFGTGMQQQIEMDKLADFVRVHTVDAQHIYSLTLNGRLFDRVDKKGIDETRAIKLGFDFQTFMLPQSTKVQGMGAFTIDNEQPILAVQKRGEVLWVLVQDETADEVTYFMGFDVNGVMVYKEKTPAFFQTFCFEGAQLFFFNQHEGYVEGFTFDPGL